MNLESTETYLTYVVAYVKLYAAMIQTEIKGVRHPHGLAEGWKWLAMFLNSLPATAATACALHAFLKMAGFALHKKYGPQFMKILDVISRCFLPALKEQDNKLQAEAVKQSTELSERQDLPGGTRRAVPRPATTIQGVVQVLKIKTPDRHETYVCG